MGRGRTFSAPDPKGERVTVRSRHMEMWHVRPVHCLWEKSGVLEGNRICLR